MSRTYKTDPWKIRAYRHEGRPVDPDWRTKWHWRNAPEFDSWDEHRAWRDGEPELPWWGGYWWRDGSSHEDRNIAERRFRAAVRDCIANEDYDGVPDRRKLKFWYDWKW